MNERPADAAPSGDQTSLGEVGSARSRDASSGRSRSSSRPRRRAASCCSEPWWWRSPGPTRRGTARTTPCSRRTSRWGSAASRWSGDLHFWINEGLMAIFFLVAGLEIKRELTTGELRRPRRRPAPGGRRGRRDGRPRAHLPRDRGWRARHAAAGRSRWRRTSRSRSACSRSRRHGRRAGSGRSCSPWRSSTTSGRSSSSRSSPPRRSSSVVARRRDRRRRRLVVLLPRIHIRATVVYVVLGVALWYAMYRAGSIRRSRASSSACSRRRSPSSGRTP